MNKFIYIYCFFLIQSFAIANTVPIEGRLKHSDGTPVQGAYPYRIQFFSYKTGGTPLSAATDSVTTLSQDGRFHLRADSPDPGGMAPEIWFNLLFDLEKNGFDAHDYYIGKYYSQRAKIGDGPFELVVRENAPATPRQTPTEGNSTVNPNYHIPSDATINVKDYGAAGDGHHDDTLVIQTAIDKAQQVGGTVYLPPGKYLITSLNMTNRNQVSLIGANTLSTSLIARQDSVHMIDLSGSMYCRLENFNINTGDRVPYTAILLGQNIHWSANALHLQNLYVTGKYSVAALYCFGCQSSDIVNCDFYNYKPDDTPVVIFTKTNCAGVKSDFTELADAEVSTGDWTLVACEIHSFAAQHGGASKAPAVHLDGTGQMRWIGGNISGSGPAYVRFSYGPRWTIFQGTTFYSDNGTPTATTFYNSDRIEGLTVDQCHLQSSESIFGGVPDAVYENIHFTTHPAIAPKTLVNCPKGRLANSFLQCGGLDIILDSIDSTLLINPGKIMAREDRATRVGGAIKNH